MNEYSLGLITGVFFGFLLQRGRVLRFDKQVGAMLLRDMTILKFMLSAIIVGGIGIYGLSDLGLIALSHKPLNLGALIVGGSLFGAGWAVMGFCPGTAVGALGEGRWHAIWAILGMIAGAALYAEAYPTLNATVAVWADFGKVSLPEQLGISHWIVLAVFSVVTLALFRFFEKKGV